MPTSSNRSFIAIFSIIVIIVLGLVLGYFLYENGYLYFLNSNQNNLNIEAQIIYNPSTGQAYLTYTIQNNGNIAINVTSIYINSYKLNNGSIIVQSNSQYQEVISLPFNIQPGTFYTVIFQGYGITNHKPFTIALNIQPTIN